MAIFLLVPTGLNMSKLTAVVEKMIPEPDRYPVANDAGWLISYKGTTVEVSNHLGITGSPADKPAGIGSVLVTLVTSYYGRGNTDMWEWLKIRMEAT